MIDDKVLMLFELKKSKYREEQLTENLLQFLFDEAKTEAYYSEKYKGVK